MIDVEDPTVGGLEELRRRARELVRFGDGEAAARMMRDVDHDAARLPFRTADGATVLCEAMVVEYVAERRRAGRHPHGGNVIRSRLLAFVRARGAVAPDEVTAGDVERFIGRTTWGPSTRRHAVSDLRMFWRWLIREGLASKDPTAEVARISQPRLLPRALRPEQVELLLDQAAGDARLAAILSLMVFEGLRCCEVARLHTDDIDWAARTVRVRGKGGHDRLLPLSDRTTGRLRALLGAAPAAGPAIRNQWTPELKGITAQYVSMLVGQHMRACGVPGSAHGLRHTMAASMLQRGANVREVQQALGHANLVATSRYLSFEVEGLRNAMHRDEPAPTPSPSAGESPEVSALIDVVADLAGTVVGLRHQLDAVTRSAHFGGPPPDLPAHFAVCDLCGAYGPGDELDDHRARRH